jgi:hypothetical protein
VALTDYPVIPKLDGFEAIAASFTLSSEENNSMKLTDLASKLGLQMEGEDSKDDETVAAAILSKFSKLAEENEKMKEKMKGLKAQEGGDGDDPDKDKDKDKDKDGEGTSGVAASLVNVLRDNRQMKLSALIQDGRISKAVGDELVEEYCSDDALTIALSTEGITDNFDKVIGALSKNPKMSTLKDKTKAQILSLDPEKNPVIANAEARAKAAS